MLTRLQVEAWTPLLLSAAVALTWFLSDGAISHLIAKELLSASISAAAVGAGFLTTALSILMTLSGSAIGRQIKRRGKLEQLYSYLRSAIYSCLLLVGVCVIAFFFFVENEGVRTPASSIVVGVAVYCMTSMARIVEILVRLFTAMSEPENTKE